MWAAGRRVNHHFSIAVVGSDQYGAALGAYRELNSAQTRVHSFYGLDGWFDLARVANHVGIGEVDNEDIEGSVFNGLHHNLGNSRGTHLRFEVVGGDFRRGHQVTVLARKWLLDSSVEEVGHVSVFLSLRHAQIAHFGMGHDIGQDVIERLRRDDYRQAEVFVVSRHTDVMQILGYPVARDSG